MPAGRIFKILPLYVNGVRFWLGYVTPYNKNDRDHQAIHLSDNPEHKYYYSIYISINIIIIMDRHQIFIISLYLCPVFVLVSFPGSIFFHWKRPRPGRKSLGFFVFPFQCWCSTAFPFSALQHNYLGHLSKLFWDLVFAVVFVLLLFACFKNSLLGRIRLVFFPLGFLPVFRSCPENFSCTIFSEFNSISFCTHPLCRSVFPARCKESCLRAEAK